MKKGWEIKRLPDIAEYFIGLTYAPKDVSDVGTIVLRSSNIQNDELDLSDLVRVTRSVKETLNVCKGDILMCSRNGSKRLVGKTAVIGSLPEVMTFGTFMTVIRGTHNPYLAWFFKSEAFREQIGVGENTMINQITKYMLDAIRVPFPPLDEQQRIVGLLDEAFEGLATAKANAEKNLQNARALFESHHNSIFTKRREGWGEKPLGEVCKYVNGKAHEQCIDKDGRFIVINSKFISTEGEILKRSNDALLLLKPGDIAMVLSDVPNGKALAKCFLVEEANTYTLNQRICLLRSTKFHTKFLFYQINRNRHFLSFDNGENQTNLRLNQVLSCPLFLPPLAEQETIADNLDALSEETQRLAHRYERKLAALEALKKSLLHQAFTGDL